MNEAPAAREVAVAVLVRVEGGAYANRLLLATLNRSGLEARDRALVTELVYGVLRHQSELDETLNAQSRRPIARLPAELRAILRVAAYQLLHLDRVPPRAAIHQAVEAAKAFGPARSGYVNGLLRSLLRAGAGAKVESVPPPWLAELWDRAYGPEARQELWSYQLQPAPLVVRVNSRRTRREDLRGAWEEQGLTVWETALSPWGLGVERAGSPEELPGFSTGLFTVQDESSQLVAPALDPQPGETVLDVGAGSGGKTTHLAELMAGQGRILALDLYEAKLRALGTAAERLGLSGIETVQGDVSTLAPTVAADRVLVDAPCSGLGVLRRHPEIVRRRGPVELERLALHQRAILLGAADWVRPGGVLLYSTCTLNPAENQEVVSAFLAARPDFRPDELGPYLPSELRADLGPGGGWLELRPPRRQTDGFFMARLRRTP